MQDSEVNGLFVLEDVMPGPRSFVDVSRSRASKFACDPGSWPTAEDAHADGHGGGAVDGADASWPRGAHAEGFTYEAIAPSAPRPSRASRLREFRSRPWALLRPRNAAAVLHPNPVLDWVGA